MQELETKLIPFVGNGPYCYSNAISMLLSTVGEQISPRVLEAYTGVGLGAFWLPKEKLLFFSSISNPPDLGISRALRLLGFNYEEKVTTDPGNPPFEQLRADLARSAAVLGPLDMGYLPHNPLHGRMTGADHFVLAYRFEKDGLMIHDPEGFPSVLLPFRELELSWRADNIGYRRGHYRYWTSPRRVLHPSQEELYNSNIRSLQRVYSEAETIASKDHWRIGTEAITTLARHVKTEKVSPSERGFMVHFSLKLGARRALDFASFFEPRHPGLAGLKQKQAEHFGTSQAYAVQRKWARVAESLEHLAGIETEFHDTLISA